MKVKEVAFYQSVRIPAHRAFETHRASAVTAETKDCEIVFHKGCVVLSHKNWPLDCVVGLANVRYMTLEKGEFIKDGKVKVDVAPANTDLKPQIEKKVRAPKK